LEEVGKARVEEWVVGVAVDLVAETARAFGKALGGGEASEVALRELLYVRVSAGMRRWRVVVKSRARSRSGLVGR